MRAVDPWSVVTDLMWIAKDRAGVTSVPGEALGEMHDAARAFLAALDIPESEGEDE